MSDDLPPLPDTDWTLGATLNHSADQMRAYALAERARIRDALLAMHERDKHRHNYWAFAVHELKL